MRVLVKESQAVLADLSFDDEEVHVGSQPDCGIHLPDVRVSPRNALIVPTAEGLWEIENIDPTNPVLLNNHVLTERKTLRNSDEIQLHEYLLIVYLEAELERHVVEHEDSLLSVEELAKIREFPLPAGAVVKRHFDPITLTMGELRRASRICVELAHCRDIHELVDVSLRILLDAFAARAAWVGIRREAEGELEVVGGRLPSGHSCEMNPLIELLQYRCVERAQHICIRKVREEENVKTAMGVPLNTPGGVLGMVYVDRPPRARRFQIPDLDLLSLIASQIAAKLDAIVRQRLRRSAAVSSAEVSVAHAIQAQLDPKGVPVWKDFQLSAYTRSGQENPGDVYDIMKHPDGGGTAFLLGHVNASGASLALSMARLHSTFRVGVLHKDRPNALARALNWLMYDDKDPPTVDAMFLVLDPASGKIEYSRGGRIGAFIVNARGEARPLQGAEAPAIGRVSGYDYLPHVDQLGRGETLALYTRGVATATNAAGERFGEPRFIEHVCDAFGETPASIMRDLTYELTNFFAEGKHPDDITIILIRRLLG